MKIYSKKELEKENRELKKHNKFLAQNFKENYNGIVKLFYGLLKTKTLGSLIFIALITFLILLDGIEKIILKEWFFGVIYIIITIAWGIMFYLEVKNFRYYKRKLK